MKGETIMPQMKELYEKVSKDSALQEKFLGIVKGSVSAGEAATKEKLITFAKEAGYDIPFEEMQKFFKDLNENNKGELPDKELEMVAGGGSMYDWYDWYIFHGGWKTEVE